MSYPYNTRAIKSPATKEVKHYVQSASQPVVTLKELAELIANSSTVSRADVKAVLDALQFQIIQALQNGRSVRLDDLGIIYSRIQSDGFDTQEACWKAGGRAVKKVTISFRRAQEVANKVNPKTITFVPSEAERKRKEAANFKD